MARDARGAARSYTVGSMDRTMSRYGPPSILIFANMYFGSNEAGEEDEADEEEEEGSTEGQ